MSDIYYIFFQNILVLFLTIRDQNNSRQNSDEMKD